MNDWLAQLYGTAPVADIEDNTNMNKTASVALLEKVAEEIGADFEGIDLDALSEEDAEEILEDLFSQLGDEGESAEGEGENAEPAAEPAAEAATEAEGAENAEGNEELDKESMAKLAEADFYGRAMAHAYVDELRTIEKQAMSKDDAKARLKAALFSGKGGPPPAKEDKKDEKDESGEEKTSAVLDGAIDSMAVDLANQWIEEHGLQKRAVSEDVQTAVQQRAVQLLIQNGYVDPSDVG